MNFDSHKPIYLQISDHICEKVIAGEYPEGERIPSVREFSALLGVNPNTVMRSFEYLKGVEVLFDK
ncbi:MAG: GntR family transcriptional regulator [Bacteroidales bacterium]